MAGVSVRCEDATIVAIHDEPSSLYAERILTAVQAIRLVCMDTHKRHREVRGRMEILIHVGDHEHVAVVERNQVYPRL